MNDSINYSGFVEMFVDSFDDYEPYGYRFKDADTDMTMNAIQLYAAGINDSNYEYPID